MKNKSAQSKNPYESVIQINYDIVKEHGGEIKVNTKPTCAGTDRENERTKFSIQLPL